MSHRWQILNVKSAAAICKSELQALAYSWVALAMRWRQKSAARIRSTWFLAMKLLASMAMRKKNHEYWETNVGARSVTPQWTATWSIQNVSFTFAVITQIAMGFRSKAVSSRSKAMTAHCWSATSALKRCSSRPADLESILAAQEKNVRIPVSFCAAVSLLLPKWTLFPCQSWSASR